MSFVDLIASMDRRLMPILGGPVHYAPLPTNGDPVDVVGIFDATFVKVDAGQAGVASSGPAVFLRLEDLPTDPEGDEPTITVNGATYTVHEQQKDGQGGVVLLLHRTDA